MRTLDNRVPTQLRDNSELSEDAEYVVKCELQRSISSKKMVALRSPVVLSGSSDEIEVNLPWTVISQSEAKFQGINFHGTLDVMAGGSFVAVDCTFNCGSEDRRYHVRVYAGSKATFERCTFLGAEQTSILIEDSSTVTVKNCHFKSNGPPSVVLSSHSSFIGNDCDFDGSLNYALFCLKESEIKMTNCALKNNQKAVILGTQKSIIDCSWCNFVENNGSAIVVDDNSHVMMEKSLFGGGIGTVIKIRNNSIGYFNKCHFKGGKSYCIAFMNSSGSVIDTVFEDISAAFLVTGPKSNPDIHNCRIIQSSMVPINVQNCASPLFTMLMLSNCITSVRSSLFSEPMFDGCTFTSVQNVFRAFEGSTIYHQNCSFVSCTNLFEFDANSQVLEETKPSQGLVDYNSKIEKYQGRIEFPTIVKKCGHEGNTERCSVCLSENNNTPVYQTKTCLICFNEANTIFLPCGHACCCFRCAQEVIIRNNLCPLCRSNITKLLFAFPQH